MLAIRVASFPEYARLLKNFDPDEKLKSEFFDRKAIEDMTKCKLISYLGQAAGTCLFRGLHLRAPSNGAFAVIYRRRGGGLRGPFRVRPATAPL